MWLLLVLLGTAGAVELPSSANGALDRQVPHQEDLIVNLGDDEDDTVEEEDPPGLVYFGSLKCGLSADSSRDDEAWDIEGVISCYTRF